MPDACRPGGRAWKFGAALAAAAGEACGAMFLEAGLLNPGVSFWRPARGYRAFVGAVSGFRLCGNFGGGLRVGFRGSRKRLDSQLATYNPTSMNRGSVLHEPLRAYPELSTSFTSLRLRVLCSCLLPAGVLLPASVLPLVTVSAYGFLYPSSLAFLSIVRPLLSFGSCP